MFYVGHKGDLMWVCRTPGLEYDIIPVSSLFNHIGLDTLECRISTVIKSRLEPEKYPWSVMKEHFIMSYNKLNWNTFLL